MTTSDRKAAVHGFDPVVRYLVDQYQIPFNSPGRAARDALHFV
jgi:hypothetical protein